MGLNWGSGHRWLQCFDRGFTDLGREDPIAVTVALHDPRLGALPTPPHPITATESPLRTPPVLTAAPKPAITPQPSSPAAVAGASRDTLVH